ncbi:hypothetical protein SLEP1_g32702 [Rubroshorea leprosula]|uniref:Uncharacterized protein n=1 Tax=Rubroshorea leprosula TaxID=152421 RepID=A0AAV5KE83_9ROSI|nr:hypothetical protein SLEP1_g32702 [Rubroshorea leprosula]
MADVGTSALEAVKGGPHDFRSLLSSSKRNFLVRNSGNQLGFDV